MNLTEGMISCNLKLLMEEMICSNYYDLQSIKIIYLVFINYIISKGQIFIMVYIYAFA